MDFFFFNLVVDHWNRELGGHAISRGGSSSGRDNGG
uniref:Uncharacterized protein n=1 Tax=Rhizophora mucronata TaxID=61149 RepID=A0A2P2M5P9_RHIMU